MPYPRRPIPLLLMLAFAACGAAARAAEPTEQQVTFKGAGGVIAAGQSAAEHHCWWARHLLAVFGVDSASQHHERGAAIAGRQRRADSLADHAAGVALVGGEKVVRLLVGHRRYIRGVVQRGGECAADHRTWGVASQRRPGSPAVDIPGEARLRFVAVDLAQEVVAGVERDRRDHGQRVAGVRDRGRHGQSGPVPDRFQRPRLRNLEELGGRSPRAQFDPEPVYATLTAVAAGEVDSYRNLEPKSMVEETKRNIEAPWTRKVRDGLGVSSSAVQASYDMKPETPVITK